MFFLYLLIEIKFIGNEGQPFSEKGIKRKKGRRMGFESPIQSSEFIESFYFLEYNFCIYMHFSILDHYPSLPKLSGFKRKS